MKKFNADLKIASWVSSIQPSAMEDAIIFSNNSDFISFALGLPDCNLLTANIIKNATDSLLKSGGSFLQYSQPLFKLKQQIVELMKKRGVFCKEAEIFLTAGAQQGISLLTRLLLNDYANIVVENLAYPGFTQAVEPFKPKA